MKRMMRIRSINIIRMMMVILCKVRKWGGKLGCTGLLDDGISAAISATGKDERCVGKTRFFAARIASASDLTSFFSGIFCGYFDIFCAVAASKNMVIPRDLNVARDWFLSVVIEIGAGGNGGKKGDCQKTGKKLFHSTNREQRTMRKGRRVRAKQSHTLFLRSNKHLKLRMRVRLSGSTQLLTKASLIPFVTL